MAPVIAEGQPIRWFSYASEDIYLRGEGMRGEGIEPPNLRFTKTENSSLFQLDGGTNPAPMAEGWRGEHQRAEAGAEMDRLGAARRPHCFRDV
jgi:hypothetical protein